MIDQNIPVFGKDAEGRRKRAFDWVLINGEPFLETVNREGRKIRTPAAVTIAAYKRLRPKMPENKKT